MYINRQRYLDKLISQKDKDIVKVITGIRRCGKSVLLFNIYYDYLLSIGVKKENIIKINLETKRNEELRNADALYLSLIHIYARRVSKDFPVPVCAKILPSFRPR